MATLVSIVLEHWALAILCAYVITLFTFATTYYSIYLRAPKSFLFHSEAAAFQKERRIVDEENALRMLTAEIRAIAALRKAVAEDTTPEPTSVLLPSSEDHRQYETPNFGFRVERYVLEAHPGKGLVTHELSVEVAYTSGEKITKWGIIGYGGDSIRQMLTDALPDKETELREAARRHASTLKEVRQPQGRVWRFWDFVYFSGVTITTVGYGDILPNRTLVRMLVLLEIVIGLGACPRNPRD